MATGRETKNRRVSNCACPGTPGEISCFFLVGLFTLAYGSSERGCEVGSAKSILDPRAVWPGGKYPRTCRGSAFRYSCFGSRDERMPAGFFHPASCSTRRAEKHK